MFSHSISLRLSVLILSICSFTDYLQPGYPARRLIGKNPVCSDPLRTSQSTDYRFLKSGSPAAKLKPISRNLNIRSTMNICSTAWNRTTPNRPTPTINTHDALKPPSPSSVVLLHEGLHRVLILLLSSRRAPHAHESSRSPVLCTARAANVTSSYRDICPRDGYDLRAMMQEPDVGGRWNATGWRWAMGDGMGEG